MTGRDPGTMTADELRREIAEILASAYRRAEISRQNRQKSVDEDAHDEAECARG